MDIRGFFQRWGLYLAIGAIVFVVAYVFIGKKNAPKTATAGTAGPLPGMASQPGSNGQPAIYYVPTTGDSYTNINETISGNNSPSTVEGHVSITNPAGVASGTSTTPTGVTTTPIPVPTTVPPAPPPVFIPPGPAPQPQPPNPPNIPRFTTYTVQSGDTLSSIAAKFRTTWPSLYTLNKSVVDKIAAEMHFVIPGGPWNNIRPGEQIQVPVS